MTRFICILTGLLLAPAAHAITALVGATVHPVTGPAIEHGVVVMEDVRIKAVGEASLLDDSMQVIDVSGKHIYPGLIAAYSHLGLVEIDAVRATRDEDETGDVNPNVSAHKAFTPDSELIPVTRSNGVLLALSAPTSGRIPGKSSVMQLAGWTWEEMLVKADAAMQINWPKAERDEPEQEHKHDDDTGDADERKDEVKELARLLDRAKDYSTARRADDSLERDLRLEALGPFVAGEKPVMVAAERQAEIEAAVAFFVDRDMRMILLGGYDADRCASLLIEHNVPVILTGVYRNPPLRHQAYDAAYTLPARLHAAGVTFCIAGRTHDLTWNLRNLPYHAATAAAHGLPRDEAIKSITTHAARILGVDDRFGSLETGKRATLIVTTGDPLEITTVVERAFVDGTEIDLKDRHKMLRDKFNKRIDQWQNR